MFSILKQLPIFSFPASLISSFIANKGINNISNDEIIYYVKKNKNNQTSFK